MRNGDILGEVFRLLGSIKGAAKVESEDFFTDRPPKLIASEMDGESPFPTCWKINRLLDTVVIDIESNHRDRRRMNAVRNQLHEVAASLEAMVEEHRRHHGAYHEFATFIDGEAAGLRYEMDPIVVLEHHSLATARILANFELIDQMNKRLGGKP